MPRTLVGTLALLVSTTACAAEAIDIDLGKRSQIAERPNLEAKDFWVYKAKDLNTDTEGKPYRTEVLGVTDTEVVLRTGRAISTYTRELNLLERQFDGKVTVKIEPSQAILKFPLQLGNKWDGAWRTSDIGTAREHRVSGSGEVQAVETVTVPAGTFQAFRVKFHSYVHTTKGVVSWSWTRQITLWYAPAVNSWVKQLRADYMPASHGGLAGYSDRQLIELQTCSKNCSTPQ